MKSDLHSLTLQRDTALAENAQLKAAIAEMNDRLQERTQGMLDRQVELLAEIRHLRQWQDACLRLIPGIARLLKRSAAYRRTLKTLARRLPQD